MARERIAPLVLALLWLAIVVVDIASSLLAQLAPWAPMALWLFAAIACWAAWRFRAWFQFSAVSRALFLPTFAWAVIVVFAATFYISELVIPSSGGGHSHAFAATVILSRSLMQALLVALIIVPPLVIVYQRYAPVVAAVLCVPVILLEARDWAHVAIGHTFQHTITAWLVVIELALLVSALVGLAWLVSRKGMLSNLSLNRTVSGGRPSAPAGTAG